MAVLAARHGAKVGDVADLLAVLGELGVGCADAGLAHVLRHQIVGDLEVAFVYRVGLGMVDIVAVEVVALLGDPTRPGEAVGIDRVHHQRAGVPLWTLGQLGRTAARQPGDLRARAAMAFDAVRARDQHQHVGRIGRPEARGVEIEGLAARPPGIRIEPRADGAASIGGSAAELAARLAVAFGKALRNRNHQALPAAMLACGRRDDLQGFRSPRISL